MVSRKLFHSRNVGILTEFVGRPAVFCARRATSHSSMLGFRLWTTSVRKLRTKPTLDGRRMPTALLRQTGSTARSAIDQHPVVDLTGGSVSPHDVADTVVVEVPDTDRDRTSGMRSHIDAARPLAVIDLPDVDTVGRRVVPDDVIDAVDVEITCPQRLPASRMSADEVAACPLPVVVIFQMSSCWSSDCATRCRSCRRR